MSATIAKMTLTTHTIGGGMGIIESIHQQMARIRQTMSREINKESISTSTER